MSRLDYNLLNRVKRAFVEQPQGDPGAGGPPPGDPGAGEPPPGGDPGMDPSMMGGMPPPGMDPSMMGGMPPPGMDPSMMGGMPPPGMDPAMAGMMPPPTDGGQGPSGSMISMSTDEFMKFIKQLVALITNAAKGNAEAPVTTGDGQSAAKLDRILGMLQGGM